MDDVRNIDGRLVCRVNEQTGVIEISVKGCITRIKQQPDGKFNIVNIKEQRNTYKKVA